MGQAQTFTPSLGREGGRWEEEMDPPLPPPPHPLSVGANLPNLVSGCGGHGSVEKKL